MMQTRFFGGAVAVFITTAVGVHVTSEIVASTAGLLLALGIGDVVKKRSTNFRDFVAISGGGLFAFLVILIS
jgi:hypothetical protein